MATIKNRLAALEGVPSDGGGTVTAIKFSVYDARTDGGGVKPADGYRITHGSVEVERVDRLPAESREDFEARANAALDGYSKPNGVPPIAWPLFDKRRLVVVR